MMEFSGEWRAARHDTFDSVDESRYEDLYDAWLDAALAGDVEDPETFCLRHGVEGGELASWISRMKAAIPARDPGASPRKVGDFRLLSPIDEGGMGVVWLAEQESLGRKAAVKLVRPELAASSSMVERFHREAAAVAKLRHPSIVSVYGFGTDDGTPWLAMELVPGKSLAEKLEGSVRRDLLLTWFRQVAEGLAAAHAEGIVHRDVKPSNILITPDGNARLVDFGLARDLGSSAATLTGAFAGSPPYASPEQWSAERGPLDARTDVWSLGATMYESLTGGTPFEADTVERLMRKVLTYEPEALRRHDRSIPKDLDVVVMKCLEKDPGRRYDTATALAEDLAAIQEMRPIRARPAGLLLRAIKWARRHRRTAAAFVLLLVLVAGGTALHFVRAHAERQDREREATTLVARSFATLTDCEATRLSIKSLEDEARRLEGQRETRYLTPVEEQRLSRVRLDAAQAKLDLGIATSEVQGDLTRAGHLDERVDRLDEAWLAFWFEKWAQAGLTGDREVAIHYRDLVLEKDGDGPYGRRVQGRSALHITTEPRDARVYLYRFHNLRDFDPAAEDRHVPVGFNAYESQVAPGGMTLRIVDPARGEGLYEDDLIVSIHGHSAGTSVFVAADRGDLRWLDRLESIDGVSVTCMGEVRAAEAAAAGSSRQRTFVFLREAKRIEKKAASLASVAAVVDAVELVRRGGFAAAVYHKARIRDRHIPKGVVARRSAAAPAVAMSNAMGKTPVKGDVHPGLYVAMVRKKGYQTRRILIQVPHSGLQPRTLPVHRHAVLIPRANIQPGFVHVACDDPTCGERPFWVMEHEVTCGEYLAFLRDVDEPDRAPRPPTGDRIPGLARWTAREGRWSLPQGVAPRMPVVGISAEDADAYAEWKNRTTGIRVHGWEYALPTRQQWVRSCGNVPEFVFGPGWSPKWVLSRFARARAGLEPVMSYPIDESRWGIFDLAGSVAEWLRTARNSPEGTQRAYASGSWQDHEAQRFKPTSIRWERPDGVRTNVGFRLVLQPREKK